MRLNDISVGKKRHVDKTRLMFNTFFFFFFFLPPTQVVLYNMRDSRQTRHARRAAYVDLRKRFSGRRTTRRGMNNKPTRHEEIRPAPRGSAAPG